MRQINRDRDIPKFLLKSSSLYSEKELKKSGMDLFVKDDGRTEFTENKKDWDKELWQAMRIELEYNFSQSKLDNIVTIMKHLRSTGHKDFQVRK